MSAKDTIPNLVIEERRLADGVRAVMETNELIRHMRARVEQCRRLAKYINDPRTTEALLKMAAEGEADIARLESQQKMELPPQS